MLFPLSAVLLPPPRFRAEWDSHRKGLWGERVVARHLWRRGFRIVGQRWKATGRSDIDLIAANRDYLLFCEVKVRSSTTEPWRDVMEKERVGRLARAAGEYLRATGQQLVSIRFAGFVVVPSTPKPVVIGWEDHVNPASVPGWRGCPPEPALLRSLS